MKNPPHPERRTFEVAEEIFGILRDAGIDAAVIGAMALAVHRYVRATRDFDLATYTDPFNKLPGVRQEAVKAGFEAELRQPDPDDPLGGVLEITGRGFKPVQVVNFLNPLSVRGTTLGKEAIEDAKSGLIEGSSMRVVSLRYLIALKLYAGGPRNRNDVIELIERHQPLDPAPIREVCARHGLAGELDSILSDLGL